MTILDMSKAAEAKSDQLNAVDLVGGSITVTITGININENSDQPTSISYEGDNGKPFKPCKTVMRILLYAYGIDGNQWIGKRLELYCDDKVRWAGKAHGGVRILNMSDIKSKIEIMLPATRGKKLLHTIGVLKEGGVATSGGERLSKLQKYKDALDDAAKHGTLALIAAWKLIPRTAQSSMELYKDKCKKTAALSDETVKNGGMKPTDSAPQNMEDF